MPGISKEALWRFREPEDAATVRLGDLLYDLVNKSRQFGPDDEENRVRPALLAVARDLAREAGRPP